MIKHFHRALLAALCIPVFMCTAGCSVSEQEQPQELEISFYYDSPCGSCHDDERYLELLALKTKDIRETLDYKATAYNTFQKAGYEQWIDTCDSLDIPEEDRLLPMAVIGDSTVSGEENIQNRLRLLICQTAGIPDGKTFWYYYRPACPDCEQIQDQLDSAFLAHPELSIIRIDTTEEKEKSGFKSLLSDRGVPDEQWQVPFLFDWEQRSFLSGWEAVQDGLDSFLDIS